MPSGVRHQRQRETRERLIGAARRVFARKGFDGASVPDIAEEAGVSTGAIYSNFSGKEELFLQMIAEIAQAGALQRAAVLADQDDPTDDDVVAEMAGGWVRTLDDQPELVLLMAEFWLYSVRRDQYRPLVAAFLDAVRGSFRETAVQMAKLDDGDASTLAAGIQALAYGYAMQHEADPDAVSAEQFVTAARWLVAGAGIEGSRTSRSS